MLNSIIRKAIVIWASNKKKISSAKAYYKYLRYDLFRFPIEGKDVKEVKAPHSYNILRYGEINEEFKLYEKNTQEKYFKFLESKFKIYNFEKTDYLLNLQNYKCACCNTRIFIEQNYEIHHKKPLQY